MAYEGRVNTSETWVLSVRERRKYEALCDDVTTESKKRWNEELVDQRCSCELSVVKGLKWFDHLEGINVSISAKCGR